MNVRLVFLSMRSGLIRYKRYKTENESALDPCAKLCSTSTSTSTTVPVCNHTCRFLEQRELRPTDENYYKRTMELAKNVIERATSNPPLLLSFMIDQFKRYGGPVHSNLSILYSSTGMPVRARHFSSNLLYSLLSRHYGANSMVRPRFWIQCGEHVRRASRRQAASRRRARRAAGRCSRRCVRCSRRCRCL